MNDYNYWKPIELSPDSAKVLEDLFRKRNEIIKARRNEFLYTKRSFDERKSLFQIYDDLEKKYEQFNERLKIIESEVDVQRYIQLFNYFTNLLSEKIVLNEESNLEGLFFEINLLLDKDNVTQYIYLKNNLESIKKELLNLRGKIIEELTKYNKKLLCPHPLYAASDDEAYCILCHKKLKFHHDDLKYLDELIKSKRLIANIDYHVATYGAEVHDVFYKLKEIVPFDEVSNYYREMYNNRHGLSQEGFITDEYPLEDYVWDHFCLERKPFVRQYRNNFPF